MINDLILIITRLSAVCNARLLVGGPSDVLYLFVYDSAFHFPLNRAAAADARHGCNFV